MSYKITRGEFLKLSTLIPFLHPVFYNFSKNLNAYQTPPQKPNILIIVYDALSAFNISMNGYERDTTPNLTRFSKRASVFHNHYAAGNFTSPGTASILTGTYPWTHRAFHLHDTVSADVLEKNIFNLFGNQGYFRTGISHNLLVTTFLYQFRKDLEIFHRTREICLVDDQLADILFSNDFNEAFWGEWLAMRGSESTPSSVYLSVAQRFYRYIHKHLLQSRYGDLFPRGIPNLHNLFFIPDQATDWITNQLETMPQPYLAYFHLLPPHEPYLTRADFVDIFNDGWIPKSKPTLRFSQGHTQSAILHSRRMYDEYLAYADAELGRLLDYMEKNGILDNTIVVFTSDHGELFERGIIGHVTETLYQPVTQVPLLISQPGQTERKDVFIPTSCVDLLPTLLYLTGQQIPDWCEGKILPSMSIQDQNSDRSIYTIEAKSNPKFAPLTKATVAMVHGRHKLIHYFGYHQDSYELYDLENDPDELNDIYNSNQQIAAELQERMKEKILQVNQPYL